MANADELRVELESAVESLKRTIEVNRQDTHGLAMRSSEIHARAVKLLAAAHRAELLTALLYEPSDSVADVLKRLQSGSGR